MRTSIRGFVVAVVTGGLLAAASPTASVAAEPAAVPAQGVTTSFIVEGPGVPDPSTLPASGAAASAAAVVIPGTGGSEFWYSAFASGGKIYTVGNVRYSWSHMWKIKNSMGTVQGLISAACALLPGRVAQAACGAVVTLVYAALRSAVNGAVAARKCLEMRFPLPPLGGLVSYRLQRVTCTA